MMADIYGVMRAGVSATCPMTSRLAEALRAHRHLRGPRVFCRAAGTPFTPTALAERLSRAARLANVPNNAPHILRHTFCSHLAMRGVPARAFKTSRGTAASARRSRTCT